MPTHPSAPKKLKLLSGGNPQIAKGDGDAPVQAYIAAMPGWKSEVGARVDDLITRNVPKVRKAVKWNSPFYGTEDKGWFIAMHVFARYVRLTFFAGTSLKPMPPGTSKTPNTRYLDIHEGELDETQLAKWIKQAAKLHGWAEKSSEPKKKPAAKKSATLTSRPASQLVDAKIKELGDWRGQTLSHVRALIKEALPDVVEEWKWSIPVWSHNGIICTGETYKAVVKTTFAKGASLKDPEKLFNSSLEGNVRRAIDFREGEKINEKAFKALIKQAAAFNKSA